jgi:hypothetical protein
VAWLGDEAKFATSTRSLNSDGTRALSNEELAERLLEIAKEEDGGAPKTGRRFWYLALSHGYVQPDMGSSEEAKKSRNNAQKRITSILGELRKSGRLDWDAVLDLTRELDEWQTYASPREARVDLRRHYDEDRWLGQPFYPILLVEKDTMEPVCKPMARRWQMPFASSRGYSSLKLQHDVAEMLERRNVENGQTALIYFVSDFDPSGLDLQRAWEEALSNFGVLADFVRIGLLREQVRVHRLDRFAIEVKKGDSRSQGFIEKYGDRCWEVDVLPADVIAQQINSEITGWLDDELWISRDFEINRARKLL